MFQAHQHRNSLQTADTVVVKLKRTVCSSAPQGRSENTQLKGKKRVESKEHHAHLCLFSNFKCCLFQAVDFGQLTSDFHLKF